MNEADEYINLGAHLYSRGDIDGAIEKFKKATKIDKKNLDALYNLGVAYQLKGDLERSVETFEKAAKLKPDDFEIYFNLGTLALSNTDFPKAIKYFNKALELNPEDINSIVNLGVSNQYLNKIDTAIDCFLKAIEKDSKNISANNNLAVALGKKGQTSKAIAYFKKALELEPDYPDAHNNLGNAYQQHGNLENAVQHYKKAIKANPNYLEAYVNLATALQDQRKLKLAIANFETALTLDPQNTYILSYLSHLLKQTCDWKYLEQIEESLEPLLKRAIKKGELIGEDPFITISRNDDPALALSVAKIHAQDLSRKVSDDKFKFKPKKHKIGKTINIGYLNNFEDKPVGYLIKDLFKNHNRKRFKVHTYNFGNGGPLTQNVAKTSDKYTDITKESFLASAKRINSDKIDILVDLKGNTRGHRLEIAALRPSKIQISYLGFPGTSGSDFFDYIIGDKTIIPAKHKKYYSEKIIRMPFCYQIDSIPEYDKKELKRADYDLPENSVVLASFNQTLKIEEEAFKIWLNVIKRIQNTCLWIYADSENSRKNLSKYAAINGVGPNKIVFFEKMPFEQFMNAMPLADIALDTFTYNGGATTSHTLWNNVPLVTKTGDHYLSRMSTSILNSIKLNELTAKDEKEYESIIADLTKSKEKRQKISRKISRNKNKFDLFNSKKFVSDLEEKYLEILDDRKRA